MAIDEHFNVFIGWDSRESVASEVSEHSIRRRTRTELEINFLKHVDLRSRGLFSRPWLVDGKTGNLIDVIDGKPFSTEYSHTRFLIPHIMNYKGWALYVDGDMIFLSDIKKLIAVANDKYALMCVKHKGQPVQNSVKMNGRLKRQYYRKNWSSLMLINCSHPSNKWLTQERANLSNGIDLHMLCWLEEHEIGEIPGTYNYISGISHRLGNRDDGKPILPDCVHYTEGGPWNAENIDVPFSDLWTIEYESWCRDADHGKDVNSMPKTIYDRAC